MLPFRLVYRASAPPRGGPARQRAGATITPERIAWAVGAASRVVPRSTCLVRALVARRLLGRHGYPTELRLGVARGEGGDFEAHAWLQHEGRVLIGGPVDPRFARLPSLEGRL